MIPIINDWNAAQTTASMRLIHAPLVLYEAFSCGIHEMAFIVATGEDARSTGCVHTTTYIRPVHKQAALAEW